MVALVIIVALLVVAVGAAVLIYRTRSAPVAEEDLAQPYREGLHAAVRLQRVAQDLEAAMFAEAARHAGGGSSAPTERDE
jgi:hypothetical protein